MAGLGYPKLVSNSDYQTVELIFRGSLGKIIEFGLQRHRTHNVEMGLYDHNVGEHIMKKVLFSVLIALVLLWNCGAVFAQGKGQQADAYERSEQKQLEMRRKDRLKMREMRRKGKEKSKVGEYKGKGKRKGKGLKEQLEILRMETTKEKAKHLRRLAWMKRIRELAVEGGSTDIVKRVGDLRRKELLRHEHKQQILRTHKRMLTGARGRKGRQPYGRSVRKDARKDIEKRRYERKYKGKDRSKKDEQ